MNIWSYWEGPKPDWVNQCLESLSRHGGDSVKILSWEDFDKLWKHDRDLPVQDLFVVQKSDFIRAYLLRHYGGVWIDADCLIMKSLEPILKMSEMWDFFYYRQKCSDLSNAFIGARKGSPVAKRFYELVHSRLYKMKFPFLYGSQPLGWLEIGSVMMNQALDQVNADCLQISAEMVAPYDWNEGEVYFEQSGEKEFEEMNKNYFLCHMLSNQAIKGFEDETKDKLEHKDSFFSYLVKKSAENEFCDEQEGG